MSVSFSLLFSQHICIIYVCVCVYVCIYMYVCVLIFILSAVNKVLISSFQIDFYSLDYERGDSSGHSSGHSTYFVLISETRINLFEYDYFLAG